MLRDFVFDGLRRNIVAGVEDDQILNAANDPPVSASVDFALVAGVKPAVAEDTRGFFGAISVAGENMWTADNDFFVVCDFHFDATNGLAHVTWLDRNARVVERADRRGFGEPIGL